jgi:5-hydroxyisourate hydrolase
MITTHVLDIARGVPAAGVTVILQVRSTHDWAPVGRGATDAAGRLKSLTDNYELAPGTYQLTFDLGDYYRENGVETPFFPEAKVTFVVEDAALDYHVPLVISPYGYSTYRGV